MAGVETPVCVADCNGNAKLVSPRGVAAGALRYLTLLGCLASDPTDDIEKHQNSERPDHSLVIEHC